MLHQVHRRRVKFTKSFELHEQHDAGEVRVCVMLGVCEYVCRARLFKLSKQLFLLRGMEINNFVLLIPWQLFDLVQCKPKVADFNDTVVETFKKQICTKLQLDCCNCKELSGANN